MPQIHVLTAVTRPENLHKLAVSLSLANSYWPLSWHWRFDIMREHVGGQHLKNEMLDQVEDGHVFMLDDDTIMHEDFLRSATYYLQYDAVVVSQLRSDGTVLRASPENIAPSCVDIGQVFFSRDVIGDHRIPLKYDGDGDFICSVLKDKNVMFIDEILSYHNFLT